MKCKTCHGELDNEFYINCENCRKHHRQQYAIRKKKKDEHVASYARRMDELIESSSLAIHMLSTRIKYDKEKCVHNIYDVNKYKKLRATEEIDCPVCLEKLMKNDIYYDLPCGHIYHCHCILVCSVSCNLCPQCRRQMSCGSLSNDKLAFIDMHNKVIEYSKEIINEINTSV